MIVMLEIVSGFALLLYGMKLFNVNVQKLYHVKIRNILSNILRFQLIGIIIGIIVTILFQASTITTVLIVALVQSRFLSVKDVVGLIMGANIGTSIAAFLPHTGMPMSYIVIIVLGTFLWFFNDFGVVKSFGEALISLGIVILGLYLINLGLFPLTEQNWFIESVSKISQPIYGIPLGIGITTLMQSSSLSNDLLEKMTGITEISLNNFFPFVMGNNIGTTTTALIASIQCDRDAKRAAVIHFLFNVIGMILFFVILRFPTIYLIEQMGVDEVTQIRLSHLFFNIGTAILLYPISNKLIELAKFLIPNTNEEDFQRFKFIQKSFADQPNVILEQSKKEIVRLGKILMTNLDYTIEGIINNDDQKMQGVVNTKRNITVLSKNIIIFLSDVEFKNEIDRQQKLKYQDISASLSAIHDSINSIANTYLNRNEGRLRMTEELRKEVKIITQNIRYSLEKSLYALDNFDEEAALDVIELREYIDNKIKKTRLLFIKEINNNTVAFQRSIVLLRALVKLNHISLSCDEISKHLLNLKL